MTEREINKAKAFAGIFGGLAAIAAAGAASAFGREAEIMCSIRAFPVVTQAV
jgi:hypothetical protein